MNEPAKAVLAGLVKGWTKFEADKGKLETTAREVAALAGKTIQGSLSFLKEQNLDVECTNPLALKIMEVPVEVFPLVETHFPNLKASVVIRCGEAHRTILIDLNLNINAGGTSFHFEQFKKGIPDAFTMNSVDFVKDAFLFVARTAGKPHPTDSASTTPHQG
jgi:hypothetical protein